MRGKLGKSGCRSCANAPPQTNGGVLGFPCRHVYAHTTPEFGTNFEHMLKGEDAALLATARVLGLPVTAKRVWRVGCCRAARCLRGDACSCRIFAGAYVSAELCSAEGRP